MVSAFLCECHDFLRLSDDQRAQHPEVQYYDSTEIIKPGCNSEGCRTNVDLMKQTKEKALPLFMIRHPNSDAFFDVLQFCKPPCICTRRIRGINVKFEGRRSQFECRHEGQLVCQ